ncbi:MAG: hypothetical protein ABSA79_09910 [Candidatus Bathyarchaeia archaeon]|jgi:hypothetical protein
MGEANSQQNHKNMMAESVNRHQFSIGLLLVFFGVADLWFVVPNMYAGLVGDWHVDWRSLNLNKPLWSFTVPLLLIITLIGTLMLSLYCIKGIQPESKDNKQNAAILVTALGFTYQVIGAWPLWNQWYPWQWQAEIARYGNWLVFPLFIGSLTALIIGGASLCIHSNIYHKKAA